MSGSLRPHGLQHARLLCPSLSPGIWSKSCPLNQSISSSAASFSFCLQSSPALGSYLFYKVLNHLSGEKVSKMHQMYSKLFSNVILCLKSQFSMTGSHMPGDMPIYLFILIFVLAFLLILYWYYIQCFSSIVELNTAFTKHMEADRIHLFTLWY